MYGLIHHKYHNSTTNEYWFKLHDLSAGYYDYYWWANETTTYPYKVFDYMAAAKPIILAIDGVIRKVVESAGCGIFCQPGNPQAIANAVIQMYNKSDLKKMGKHGQHYLQRFLQ